MTPEKYLEKNYIIKNNVIVYKWRDEEFGLFNLIYEIKKIFFITEDDSFKIVFDYVKNLGFDLNNNYCLISNEFVKINDFKIQTSVEMVERSIFEPRTMGRTKTEIEINITDANSVYKMVKLFREGISYFNAVSPIKHDLFYNGFYCNGVFFTSMDNEMDVFIMKGTVDFYRKIMDE